VSVIRSDAKSTLPGSGIDDTKAGGVVSGGPPDGATGVAHPTMTNPATRVMQAG